MPLDLKFKIFVQVKQVQAFSKTLFFIFSINMHLSRKSIFAEMKLLLWLKNYTLLSLREKNQENRDNYKIQHNLCKKLLRKPKDSYFSNFDTKKITNNRTFWKTVVPLFTNKPSKSENIINEGDKSISDEKK